MLASSRYDLLTQSERITAKLFVGKANIAGAVQL